MGWRVPVGRGEVWQAKKARIAPGLFFSSFTNAWCVNAKTHHDSSLHSR